MSEALSVADVRKSLGKAFNRAHYAKEVIRVEKHGDPFVAVVSNDDGDNILEIRELAEMLEMDPTHLLTRLRQLVREEEGFRERLVGRHTGSGGQQAATKPRERSRDAVSA